ncbi:MAG: hypothetical protein HY801_05265 [Candidatus Lindowbacteria bacterium]|nr:hypothetical protein [Candidatus Lindowbacteria bacterium]
MGYYVYLSKVSGEARIHYGQCPQCNHGYGSQEMPAKPETGKWLGPFSSYLNAETAAEEAEARVLDCVDCMP